MISCFFSFFFWCCCCFLTVVLEAAVYLQGSQFFICEKTLSDNVLIALRDKTLWKLVCFVLHTV